MNKLDLGARSNDCAPIFVDSDQSILGAFGSTIKKLSCKTGEAIGSFNAHATSITCLVPVPAREDGSDDSMVLSASTDGVIIVWNHVVIPSLTALNSSFLHASDIDVDAPPSHEELYIIGIESAAIFDAKSKKLGKSNSKMVIYELRSKKELNVMTIAYARPTMVNKLASRGLIARLSCAESSESDWIVAAANASNVEEVRTTEQADLMFWSSSKKRGFFINADKGMITCLATSESANVLLTGHDNGAIVVWHNIKNWLDSVTPHLDQRIRKTDEHRKKKDLDISQFIFIPDLVVPMQTVMHWHSHPVSTICLASDGRSAYSGGEEGVFVKWQISGDALGNNSFIPRLGAGISHIRTSSNEAVAVVATNDNCIRIVNIASLRQVWLMRSLALGENSRLMDPDAERKKTVMRVEPRSGHIVCNSLPGILQVLEADSRNVLPPYQITHFIRVSGFDSSRKTHDPYVTHVAFDDGMEGDLGLMATVDKRFGEKSDGESCLKFWIWSQQRQRYQLEAQMDSPHINAEITCLLFQPKAHRIVLTGASDGSLKCWERSKRQSAKDVNRMVTGWTCSYSLTHREVPITAMSFSYDGSVLAVAQGSMVYIWDPVRIVLKTSISANIVGVFNKIKFLDFIEPNAKLEHGSGAGEAILMIGSWSSVAAYDMLNLKSLWTKQGKYTAMTVRSQSMSASDSSCLLAVASERHHPSKNRNMFEVSFLDIHTGESRRQCESSARVTALAFRIPEQKSSSHNLGDGVYAATEDWTDLFFFGRHNKFNVQSMSNGAEIRRTKKLPSLPYQLSNEGKSDEPANRPNKTLLGGSLPGASKIDISNLFDKSSQNIPPVAQLFDSFIQMVALPQKDSNVHSSIQARISSAFSSSALIEGSMETKTSSAMASEENISTSKKSPFNHNKITSDKLQHFYDSQFKESFFRVSLIPNREEKKGSALEAPVVPEPTQQQDDSDAVSVESTTQLRRSTRKRSSSQSSDVIAPSTKVLRSHRSDSISSKDSRK